MPFRVQSFAGIPGGTELSVPRSHTHEPLPPKHHGVRVSTLGGGPLVQLEARRDRFPGNHAERALHSKCRYLVSASSSALRGTSGSQYENALDCLILQLGCLDGRSTIELSLRQVTGGAFLVILLRSADPSSLHIR